jgi:hypothetical protein
VGVSAVSFGTGSERGGGSGITNSISGTSVTYSAGGAGAPFQSGVNAASGGGVNTGGGGGGGGGLTSHNTSSGAPGSSGVVVLRYSDTFPVATVTGSPTVTVSGGFRTYVFTGSGTINIPS